MKTINKVLGVVLLTVVLSACFGGDSTEVKDAKEKLGVIEPAVIDTILDDAKIPANETIVIPEGTIPDEPVQKVDTDIKTGSPIDEKENTPVVIKSEEIKKDVIVSGKALTTEKFIELNSINESALTAEGLELSGKTIGNVDKIIVHFSNEDSDLPNDSYTLQTFKPGDTTFLYRAFSQYETFAPGKNTYLFVAYSGTETSEVELVLNYNVLKNESVSVVESMVEKTTETEDLTPGVKNTTQLEMDGFSMTSEDVSKMSCDTITDFLQEKLNAWFYWNTCRDIHTDKGYNFYVVRLDGDTYFYEKHYTDIATGTYGVYLLESGEGVTTDGLAELNQTLKLKNDSYTGVDVVDAYFEGL